MKKKDAKEEFLGEIRTEIAGTQYYDAPMEPGEAVHLQREPDNPHDPNAIRVENADSRQVGHLPRRLATWLAPLLDEGKIRLDGLVSAEDKLLSGKAPLTLKVYLCAKGRHILRPLGKPGDALEALHEMVRRTYAEAASYGEPAVVEALGEKLKDLEKRDVLPETHLLIELFSAKARSIHQRRAQALGESLKKELSALSVGEPMHHVNITIFPLIGPTGRANCVPLAEAVRTKQAVVEEVGEAGDVSRLRVVNRGDRPVLILEGEMLRGAKQDRIVIISVIVAAAATYVLPVSCVERGRWSYVSEHFRPEGFAPPGLRATARTAEAAAGGGRQSRIWDEVNSVLDDVRATSETQTLADAYKVSKGALAEYRKSIGLPKGARGFLVASKDKVIGLDLFDSPGTLRRYWRRLSDAYFLEALRAPKALPKARKSTARSSLREFARSLLTRLEELDSGTCVRAESGKLAGTAVWSGDRLCHLSAFALPERRKE